MYHLVLKTEKKLKKYFGDEYEIEIIEAQNGKITLGDDELPIGFNTIIQNGPEYYNKDNLSTLHIKISMKFVANLMNIS